ncbi:hypothetical protein FKM82_000944 [Ascaphus truei]
MDRKRGDDQVCNKLLAYRSGLPLTFCISPILTTAYGPLRFHWLQPLTKAKRTLAILSVPTSDLSKYLTILLSPILTWLPDIRTPDVPPLLWVAFIPIPTSVPGCRLVGGEHSIPVCIYLVGGSVGACIWGGGLCTAVRKRKYTLFEFYGFTYSIRT